MKQFAIVVGLAILGALMDLAIRWAINPDASWIYQLILGVLNGIIIRHELHHHLA